MGLGEIDWDKVITIIGAILSGGFGGGFLTAWWAKSRDRKDKLDERRQLRSETFRAELRHAYAQFVAAQSKRLAMTSDLVALLRFLRDAEVEVRGREPALRYPRKVVEEENPQFVTKARTLRDAVTEAQAEAAFRLAELLLLESDQAFAGHLLVIFEAPLEWSDREDQDIDTQLATHEGKLKDLVRLMVGAFAPERWDNRQRTTLNEGPPMTRLSDSTARPT